MDRGGWFRFARWAEGMGGEGVWVGEGSRRGGWG